MTDSGPDPSREIRRVRHEPRRRVLTVLSIVDITPLMRRIVLQAPELGDFVSLSFDDHLKIFLPGDEPIMRDYTPRAFDTIASTVTIDFALHDMTGPVTAWAANANPGDTLNIGSPRGSSVIPTNFDWHLLVGDETALPAMGRRVEELTHAAVITIAVVDTLAERQSFSERANWTGHWVSRDRDGPDDASTLSAKMRSLAPKTGDGFVWIAAEAKVTKALKAVALEMGHPPRQLKASGYWVRGDVGRHQPIE